MTVYGGTQKISMGRNGDTDYKSKLAAAKAQAGPNSYVQGVQSVMDDGAGVAIQNTCITMSFFHLFYSVPVPTEIHATCTPTALLIWWYYPLYCDELKC